MQPLVLVASFLLLALLIADPSETPSPEAPPARVEAVAAERAPTWLTRAEIEDAEVKDALHDPTAPLAEEPPTAPEAGPE